MVPPPAWALKRGELYSNKEWQDKLRKNPDYTKVGQRTDSLRNIVLVLKSFTEPLVDVEIVRDAHTAVENGIDLVTTTFILFNVVVDIPRIRSQKIRGQKIQELRSVVAAKRCRFGADLAARLEELEEEEFE